MKTTNYKSIFTGKEIDRRLALIHTLETKVDTNTNNIEKIKDNIKSYKLPLGEASWVRIAKVKDIYKNSSGVFTFNCYGEKAESNEILTTSVFSVSCGLDETGKLITDVLPITQAPELDGSSSSGDLGGSGGSGGSGGTGIFGLTSIRIEEYVGEMYVCGLVNYPSTEDYTSLIVEMSINNNLNFDYLDSLEVVDLTDVNEEKQQILEGMTLEANRDYEFRLTCNLEDLKTGMDSETTFEVLLPESTIDYSRLFGYCRSNYGTIRIWAFNGITSLTDAETSDFSPNIFFNFETYNNNKSAEIDYDYNISGVSRNYTLLQQYGLTTLCNKSPYMNVKFSKLSGKLTFRTSSAEAWKEIYLEFNNSNEVKVIETIYDSETDGYVATYSFENLVRGQDELYVVWNGCEDFKIALEIDFANSDIEISFPFKSPTSFPIGSYTIENNDIYNFKLTMSKLYKHVSSQSYDLFSTHNLVDKVDELDNRTNELENRTIELAMSNFRYHVLLLRPSNGEKKFYMNILLKSDLTNTTGDIKTIIGIFENNLANNSLSTPNNYPINTYYDIANNIHYNVNFYASPLTTGGYLSRLYIKRLSKNDAGENVLDSFVIDEYSGISKNGEITTEYNLFLCAS